MMAKDLIFRRKYPEGNGLRNIYNRAKQINCLAKIESIL